ncbi:uncharacterized protein STEHIDRAFT_165520 [Stereum hirsutum FP-91666 SS1]|uniref:uncharacterized protein n=1 Tax=Stereum hirsutum (strain FP-91666) TaxID=721885 RepID=UPI000440DA9F|nr:uncharacterized protein STEHIDRAFT_165520 [Stereum hirsutum FP-91666 SS1]EIM91133.1 hypothetical protein STEHIDRAFT_165520 [Stereum hirsutum FP-91666 SS1]
MSATNTSQYTSTTVWLAPSNSGRWIFKTQARELWDLAGGDLDSILPRSIAPNRHGGPWNEYKYNESDVANLSVRLNRETFTDVSANAPLAPRLGPEIKRDDAMSEFRLEDYQTNRIMPVRMEICPDPDNSTRYYNRIDVVFFLFSCCWLSHFYFY